MLKKKFIDWYNGVFSILFEKNKSFSISQKYGNTIPFTLNNQYVFVLIELLDMVKQANELRKETSIMVLPDGMSKDAFNNLILNVNKWVSQK